MALVYLKQYYTAALFGLSYSVFLVCRIVIKSFHNPFLRNYSLSFSRISLIKGVCLTFYNSVDFSQNGVSAKYDRKHLWMFLWSFKKMYPWQFCTCFLKAACILCVPGTPLCVYLDGGLPPSLQKLEVHRTRAGKLPNTHQKILQLWLLTTSPTIHASFIEESYREVTARRWQACSSSGVCWGPRTSVSPRLQVALEVPWWIKQRLIAPWIANSQTNIPTVLCTISSWITAEFQPEK